MATATEVPRLPSPALPPSPPPSPPRRRHQKRRSDPFLELENIPIVPSPQPGTPTAEPEEPQESLLVRLVLTPLYFTSFLLSLSLINRSDRLRRTTSSNTSLLSYLSPTAWLADPEPYQDPASSTWERRDSTANSHVEPNAAIQNARLGQSGRLGKDRGRGGRGREGSWHLHKRILKIAKLEISDAFEMRGRMIVLLLTLFFLTFVAVFLVLRWVMRILW